MNENPYYNDVNQTPVRQESKSGLSVAAFILSIISILTCLFLLNIPFALISIILAIIALAKKYGKKGLAGASIIISAFSLAISTLMIILLMPLLSVMSDLVTDITRLNTDENYKEIIEEYERTGELPDYMDKYSEGEIGEFFDKYFGGFDKFFDQAFKR